MTQRGRTIADLIAENKVIFLILLVLFIGLIVWLNKQDVLVKVGPFQIGSEKNVNDTVLPQQKIFINGDNNVNGNNNNIYQIKYVKKSSKYEYTIIGTKNIYLVKQIKDLINIKFVTNSKKYIKITFTGEIRSLDKSNNSYYYTGGFLKIIVNDNCEHVFTEYKIEEMRPNSIDIINQELDNKINYYVDLNVTQISKKIVKCLQNQL